MKQETVKLINGNGQEYIQSVPKIIILGKKWNDVALDHIAENTGLRFIDKGWGMEAQPISFKQIATLLMTYNFKTRYYDNWDHKNTLMLKSDHHIGFEVDDICFDCVKRNHITTQGLTETSRLAC